MSEQDIEARLRAWNGVGTDEALLCSEAADALRDLRATLAARERRIEGLEDLLCDAAAELSLHESATGLSGVGALDRIRAALAAGRGP